MTFLDLVVDWRISFEKAKKSFFQPPYLCFKTVILGPDVLAVLCRRFKILTLKSCKLKFALSLIILGAFCDGLTKAYVLNVLARQDEIVRKEQEKQEEYHTRASRIYEWLHMPVNNYPVTDSVINQG